MTRSCLKVIAILPLLALNVGCPNLAGLPTHGVTVFDHTPAAMAIFLITSGAGRDENSPMSMAQNNAPISQLDPNVTRFVNPGNSLLVQLPDLPGGQVGAVPIDEDGNCEGDEMAVVNLGRGNRIIDVTQPGGPESALLMRDVTGGGGPNGPPN